MDTEEEGAIQTAETLKAMAEAEGKTMFPIRGTPSVPYPLLLSLLVIANLLACRFQGRPPNHHRRRAARKQVRTG